MNLPYIIALLVLLTQPIFLQVTTEDLVISLVSLGTTIIYGGLMALSEQRE